MILTLMVSFRPNGTMTVKIVSKPVAGGGRTIPYGSRCAANVTTLNRWQAGLSTTLS
ncbi:MAG: hypothetical protein QOI76_72 [Frankiales bacterium]|nr:hypothetical protein [Frankiales bacterium]